MRIFIKIIKIYLIISFLEWFLHKYIMHGDADFLQEIPFIGHKLKIECLNHLNHHKGVQTNMEIIGEKNGLFFKWRISIILIFIINVLFIITSTFENKKNGFYVSIILSLTYFMLWNTIHPEMHFIVEQISWKKGIPSQKKYFNFDHFIYKWLLKNHTLHHLQKNNKGNFNIILPGFDYIFNTYYDKCYDNTDYCLDNKNETRVCGNKEFIKRCLY